MRNSGLRARVIRLLAGEFREDDLTRLFLYARDRCDGRESIQEIGDFVAHPDERIKGVLTRRVRDWYANVSFSAPAHAGYNIDGTKLPANFPNVLQAAFRRAPSNFFGASLGASRVEVGKMLPVMIGKLIRNADGTLSVSTSHSEKERHIMSIMATTLFPQSAFNGTRLYKGFAAVLRSNKLLEKEEGRRFESVSSVIQLFAITVMHNSELRINDITTIPLSASAAASPSGAGVLAIVPAHVPPGNRIVGIGTAIFSTNLDPSVFCARELLESPEPWDFDLEINNDKMLDILG